jgi:hypothetical protein
MALVVSLLLEDLSSDELIVLRKPYLGTPFGKLCHVQISLDLWKISELARTSISANFREIS